MKLSKDQSRQRWRELREILNEWDPIGVVDPKEGPWDEYQSYAGPILRYLEQDAPDQAISDYLEFVVTESMGLSLDPSRSKAYAAKIIAWYREKWPGTIV